MKPTTTKSSFILIFLAVFGTLASYSFALQYFRSFYDVTVISSSRPCFIPFVHYPTHRHLCPTITPPKPRPIEGDAADSGMVLRSKREDENNYDEAGQGADVPVGSKEYLEGFVKRGVDVESAERISGEALLGPTLRLAGWTTAMLAALFLAFMASNGLI